MIRDKDPKGSHRRILSQRSHVIYRRQLLYVQIVNVLNKVAQLGGPWLFKRFSFDVNQRAFVSFLLAMIKICVTWNIRIWVLKPLQFSF